MRKAASAKIKKGRNRFMKRKIEKGRLARCPYCDRYINYFFLYESKHYDFGHCSHCGGIYAVRYSGWASALTAAALLATAVGVLLSQLAHGGLPSWKFFLLMALVLAVIYVLIPVFILPTKCVVEGKLGGFPDRDSMPDGLQKRVVNGSEAAAPAEQTLSEEARKMFVGFSPEDYSEPEKEENTARRALKGEEPTEEPTMIAAEPGEPLSAQERFRRAQKNRTQARHSR